MTGDVVIVTGVTAGREDELREHLRGLDDTTGPLGGMTAQTHFARFVVLPLDGFKLFFSSRFDGSRAGYLAELADRPAAAAIWSFCDPQAAGDPGRLGAYLEAHAIAAPYVLAAWSEVSVAEVNAAVGRRARLSGFAVRAAGLDPVGLAHAFREEFRR
ncbi:MAG: hypothetical protein QOE44_3126 [Solirubrobacteraceae bacterium]|jgi:hypothetical protein|nr:hypothetical protein [Solirubrobacteraceae bacterium]